MMNLHCNYILYGAAAIGNIVNDSMKQLGLNVVGYIDKRAFELESYNNLPVWTVDGVPEIYYSEETIVYVAVKNVFEHEKIAEMLRREGFAYIIYKPYSVLLGYGTENENLTAEIYEGIFDHDVEVLSRELPVLEDKGQKLHDFAMISNDGEYVTAYIPMEFIYTNNYKEGGMTKWGNVWVPAFFTHIEFFRYLDNQEEDFPYAYLEEYCVYTARLQGKIKVTDAWKENVISNRAQIYEQMTEALNLDYSFFIRNAPEAEWNERRGYFNLTSGKHRSTFLASKGLKYIPLRVGKRDYEAFCNEDAARQTACMLQESGREVLIPNPYFYRGNKSRDKGDYTFLVNFARYFSRIAYRERGRVSFNSISIIDRTDDLGSMARCLSRMGCRVHRSVEPCALERQLNRLFRAELYYGEPAEDGNGFLEVVDGHYLCGHKDWRPEGKNVIAKSISENELNMLCQELGMSVKAVMSSWCEGLEKRCSYLLEG